MQFAFICDGCGKVHKVGRNKYAMMPPGWRIAWLAQYCKVLCDTCPMPDGYKENHLTGRLQRAKRVD